MSEYLNDQELHQLTGYARTADRARWLKENGIPHRVNNNRVIVSKQHVASWLEGRHVAFGVFNRSLIK